MVFINNYYYKIKNFLLIILIIGIYYNINNILCYDVVGT